MPQKIYIAAKGIITALGNNLSENKKALFESKDTIDVLSRLKTNHQLPAAEIQFSNEELAQRVGLEATITRTALLSMLAAKEAFDNFDLENKMSFKGGFISSNTVGGMDKSEDFIIDFLQDQSMGKLHQIIHHDSGASSEIVADKLGIKDVVSTISTACSSAANAIIYASRLIRHGQLDWCIAGGTDSLSRFTVNGFNSLMILDKNKCRPFDDTREGLNLGEGAGYVVLVSEAIADMMKSKPTIYLAGYCNANDAYHQTASSPEGIGNYMAMQGALKNAGLSPSDIDYINLHGTGTQNNDSSEAAAIERLFGENIPPYSSTKSMTGHTLAACGAIEAIFSAMTLEENLLPNSLRFSQQMAGTKTIPTTSSLSKKVQHAMSNSFGFGGNCSTLIFSKTTI
jgi:3-oxoacyl-(acyl-carrier-protein) synthase